MSRRWTIIIIILLFAGMAALAWFLQQRQRAWASSPYSSIPLDAGIIIEAVDMPGLFASLAGDNELVAGMSEIPGLHGFTSAIDMIDSLAHSRELRQLAGNKPVLISIHLLGRDRLTPFFAFAASPEIRDKHIRSLLEDMPGYGYTEKEYEGSIIYELRDGDGEGPVFYLSLVHGIIMASRSHILVEAGIRQMPQEKDIRDLQGFGQVAAAAGKNENKLFLVFENMPRIVSMLTGDSGRLSAALPGLASCLEADLYLKKEGFMLSGYIAADEPGQTLYKYRDREPGSFDIYRYIPAGAAMFEIMTSGAGEGAVSADEATRYISDILRSQLTGSMARVYLDIQGQEAEESRLMLFDLRGSNATEKAFAEELASYYRAPATGSADHIISYKPDAETEYIIYRLPDESVAAILGGGFGDFLKSRYATFYDGILVLSNTEDALTKVIYDNILNRTLANDLLYREFESTMPSSAGYYFYCVPSKILPLLEGLLKDDIVEGLERNKESLRKLQAVGYQFVSSNDMLYNTLSVMYRPEIREEARAVWESLLDTVAYSKPLFFTNHYTGGSEIFIQDLNNKLYLINSAGRILWKRPVDEAMKGSARVVDYYNNGKLQILFATEHYLHLLDRNGNYVERYPVQLRSPATNGLALFDYENNKDYRLFICGRDHKVYAYDKTGSTVKGWNQFKTTGRVASELEFFRVSGKDYLVVNDDNNMYILNRRGEVRVGMKEQVARSLNSSLRLTTGTSPEMVLASVDGSVKRVNFRGEVTTYSLNDFSDNPVFEYFDLDADGQGEYIFFDGGRIYAYDNDRSRMFSLSTGGSNILGPYGLEFSSADRKLGFVDPFSASVHIIDERGRDLKGFPLSGTTPFSVGRLGGEGSYNLVTGGSDSFLYNYELTR